MSIESWAQANGETPKHTVEAWFAQHPDLVEQVVAARQQGWARAQILRWLQDEHAYPLRDDEAIERVGR